MKGTKSFTRVILTAILIVSMVRMVSVSANASDFDPAYYAAKYPDVVAAYGTDPNALYQHYVTFGVNEHRFKNAFDEANNSADPNAVVDNTPKTYVDVDILGQTMTYYIDGNPVLSSPIVTGNINNGNGTPTGVFFIDTKIPGKRLVGPTWDVWVDRWMRFTGNVGLHDASWRSQFGGNVYTYNGSHGCVNLPTDVAKTLYDMVSVGTMVIVH